MGNLGLDLVLAEPKSRRWKKADIPGSRQPSSAAIRQCLSKARRQEIHLRRSRHSRYRHEPFRQSPPYRAALHWQPLREGSAYRRLRNQSGRSVPRSSTKERTVSSKNNMANLRAQFCGVNTNRSLAIPCGLSPGPFASARQQPNFRFSLTRTPYELAGRTRSGAPPAR